MRCYFLGITDAQKEGGHQMVKMLRNLT